MYVKNNSFVTFFHNPHKENTDKVTFGRVSEAIKTGRKDGEGKDVYEFESWDARFVGKAREKAEALEDKARLTLTECSFRNPYNKDKKRPYPYVMVMDFEVREDNAVNETGFVEIDDDGELPF